MSYALVRKTCAVIEHVAPPETLVGRLEETSCLRDFVRQVTVNGGALILSGDPGVGKSALLEAAARFARASAVTILRVTGAEFEARVSFAALNQALLPLADRFSELGEEHARTLKVALGLESGPAPDRLLLGSAVTMLLKNEAARRPLLLIVDDLPWLDRATAGILCLIGRRLGGTRAGLLAAYRTGEAGYLDASGLPQKGIGALSDDASARLLSDRFPHLGAAVRARVLATAQGNPLALLELPQALHSEVRGSSRPLPRFLPLGERLQRLYASQVRALPTPTRTLLLAAALESTCELRLLQAAASAGYNLDDLAPAERQKLVWVDADSQRVTFRHPLLRAAVVAESTSDERRRVHRALSVALAADLERRAWHLGEATVEPDEEVAALLEAAARRVASRGDYEAAISLLCRAADLSPSADDRRRRMAEAAFMGAEGMAPGRNAAELLEGARQAGRPARVSLHYASAAALLVLGADGQLDTAHGLMAGAIRAYERPADGDDQELRHALRTLAGLCYMGQRSDLWPALHEGIAKLASGPPELLSVCLGMAADPVRTGVAMLPRLERALASVHRETDPVAVQTLASSATFADRIGDVREPLLRIVQAGRAGGSGRNRIGALMHLCIDNFHRGQWAEAAELAAEGLSVCEEFGASSLSWCFHYHQALQAAVHGRFEASRALAGQVISWSGPRGISMAWTYAHHALVLAAAGQSDFENTYRYATVISPAGTLTPYVPQGLWVALDLVESAVRTGRTAEAERHAGMLQETGVAALSPRLALVVAACAALVAKDDDAVEAFDRALGLPRVQEWPFDAARVRLLYGERLRRIRAAGEARAQLEPALAIFEELDAAPWAARAERELRAAGRMRRNRSSTPGSAGLTPQEMEIARLAASGMTNKQIAEQLFLSPRTVSTHLYQIFPKLGITKRAALRDAIGSDT
ncbi:helix-turn-helix transcriptional regulator [Actinacidiphila guanduensis]|nr:LuxR family transcriptional regulator [Actinacidiphila guanduensis]